MVVGDPVVAAGRRFTPENYEAPDEGGPATPHEDAAARLALLTRQQARILQLICEGKLNKQIAYDLSLSERTIKMHRAAMFRSLGVKTAADAIRVAIEAGY